MTGHLFLCLILGLGATIAQDDPATTARRLVEQLRSEDIAVRDKAIRGLKALGEAARPALEAAATTASADIVQLAKTLLRRLDIARKLTPAFVKARDDALDRLATDDDHAWTQALLDSNQWTPEGLRRYPTLRRPDLEPLVATAFRGAKSIEEKRDLCLLCEDWRLRSAIPELVRHLEDADVKVRALAARYLGMFESFEHEETLVEMLKSRGLDARVGAAEGLVSMGARRRLPDILSSLRNYMAGNQSLVVRSMGRLGGREHIDFVLALLKRGMASFSAIEALGVLRASEHADLVAPYLKDGSAEMRSLAAEALGRMGATKHADAVAELLSDPDWNCGIRSVLAVEALGQARHVPQLIPLMKDPRQPTRAYAIRAVKSLGGVDRIPELAALLESPERDIRLGAAAALIALKSKDHAAAILKMIIDEPDSKKFISTYENLLTSGSGLFKLDLDGDARKSLIEAYRRHGGSEVFWIRHAALIGLLSAGELSIEEQASLVDDVLEFPGEATGPLLARSLAQVYESKAWNRLQAEVELTRSLETPDDLKTWLKELGFDAALEGNLVLSGRFEKGRRSSPAQALEQLAWRPRVFLPEGSSLLILRWDAALEKWAKRLGKK